MKLVQSLCTLALSAAPVAAFAPSSVAGGRASLVAAARTTATVAVPLQQQPRVSRMSSLASSSALYMSASPEEFAKSEIENNKVVIFSKSYCPFCSKTKDLFQDLGVDATVYELNEMDDGSDIEAALLDLSGQKTVPNVFINGQHVGGNDNVQAANRSGELKKLLEA